MKMTKKRIFYLCKNVHAVSKTNPLSGSQAMSEEFSNHFPVMIVYFIATSNKTITSKWLERSDNPDVIFLKWRYRSAVTHARLNPCCPLVVSAGRSRREET